MKKILILTALISSVMLAKPAAAQVSIGVHLNIGSQPEWGPTGYDYVNYYYMPDIDAYYDVPAHRYVYLENNVWVHRAYLPVRYRNYDMYNGYKVVVNNRNPWLRHSYYRTTYASYRGRAGQAIIRDSRDDRYREHWHADNGRHNGWGRPQGPQGNQGNWGHGGGDHGRGHGDDHGHGGGHGRGHH